MTSHKWPISQTVLYLKLQHGGSHSNIHIEVNFVVISRHYFILEKLPKRRSRRVPWTDSEKKAVKAELGHFITKLMVPGKLDCDKCLKKRKELSRRTWKDIKNFVHNTIQTVKRKYNFKN